MLRAPILAAAMALSAISAMSAAAQDAAAQDAQSVVQDLFAGGDVAYTPEFLDAVPESQVTALVDTLQRETGPVLSVELSGGQGYALTATHRVPVKITLDAEGRIAGLFLQAPERLAADLPTALATLSDVAEDVVWLVTQDGAVLAEQGADVPVPVASAFKLGVLAVLADDIAAGARDWRDVTTLAAHHISLPSGRMQDWPTGSPVTLHTAALLMISESDNTATDLLIDVLGRDRVAARLGLPVQDLLTTRELFALKADPAAVTEWLGADSTRPAIAAQAAQTLPDIARASGPQVPGLGWPVSLTRLCALMGTVGDLPLMAVNPGPVPVGDWAGLAFKGGSEAGILNMTVQLRDDAGRRFCVAANWTGTEPPDPAQATAALRTVLHQLGNP